MSRNINEYVEDCNDENDCEDDKVVSVASHETTEAAERELDKRNLAGFQTDIKAFEAIYAKLPKDSFSLGDSKTVDYVKLGRVYGDVDDKIVDALHVYPNDIVAFFQADLSTKQNGYSICRPFTVIGEFRDPATGHETIAIQFRDRHNQIRNLAISRGVIAEGPAKLIPYLEAFGFSAPAGKKLREYVHLLFSNVRGLRAVKPTSTGWVRSLPGLVFATPEKLIGEVGAARVIPFQLPNVKVAKRGTYEGWRQGVRSASGNSRLQFALAIAFTSPVLRFAPAVTPPVFQLYGESSIGKTVATLMAGSIWGGSEGDSLGYGHSWNGTLNFQMALAAAHSGTLLVLDEMGTGENIEKAAYSLASGQDRNRLDKNSNQRRGAKFETCILSTGEVTLDEKLRSSSLRSQAFAGMEVRVPSIPADAGKGFGIFDRVPIAGAEYLARNISENARENYGHAGPLFVEKLIAHLAPEEEWERLSIVNNHVKRFVESLKLDVKADDAVRRLACAFGLVAYAGRLACQFDVLPFEAEEMEDSVRRCFLDWLASRGGSRSKTTATALIALRDFISRNQGKFIDIGDTSTRVHDTAGYVEHRENGSTYYLLQSSWKTVIEAAPRAKLIEELDRLMLLKRQKSSKSVRSDTIVKAIPKQGGVRVYAVRGEILELRDDGTIDGRVIEVEEPDAPQASDVVVPMAAFKKSKMRAVSA